MYSWILTISSKQIFEKTSMESRLLKILEIFCNVLSKAHAITSNGDFDFEIS